MGYRVAGNRVTNRIPCTSDACRIAPSREGLDRQSRTDTQPLTQLESDVSKDDGGRGQPGPGGVKLC
jgi:hypothetical protein